jgi:hypothetical protein
MQHFSLIMKLRLRDQPNACARQHAKHSQIKENDKEVPSGDIQQITAERWAEKPGNEAIGCEYQPEYSPKVFESEAVVDQWGRDCKQGSM